MTPHCSEPHTKSNLFYQLFVTFSTKSMEAGTQFVQIESVVHAFHPHKIMYQALSAFGTASGKSWAGPGNSQNIADNIYRIATNDCLQCSKPYKSV